MNKYLCAAQVMAAEYVPVESVLNELIDERTPEAFLIEQESEILSRRLPRRHSRVRGAEIVDEAKELAQIILNAPSEMFYLDGRLRRKALNKYCWKEKGWSAFKVNKLMNEVGFFIRSFKMI